jgi:hypothetical protein
MMPLELTDEDLDVIAATMREVAGLSPPTHGIGHALACEAAYLAGLRAGIERAAQVCDARIKGAPPSYASEAQLCAAAIRALLA